MGKLSNNTKQHNKCTNNIAGKVKCYQVKLHYFDSSQNKEPEQWSSSKLKCKKAFYVKDLKES